MITCRRKESGKKHHDKLKHYIFFSYFFSRHSRFLPTLPVLILFLNIYIYINLKEGHILPLEKKKTQWANILRKSQIFIKNISSGEMNVSWYYTDSKRSFTKGKSIVSKITCSVHNVYSLHLLRDKYWTTKKNKQLEIFNILLL